MTLQAFSARDRDGIGLAVDGGNALHEVLRAAMDHHLLLLVEQRQHLTVFLQFFPQRFDQILQEVFHE